MKSPRNFIHKAGFPVTQMNRTHWSMLALAALVLFFGIRWLLSPPTISVNFVDAPLREVIPAIEKQGRVVIRTNLDPETPVTLQIRRAPVIQALDLLAARAEGNLRLAYILGPDRQSVREGVELVVAPREERTQWRNFYFPVDQWAATTEPPDPRSFKWNVESQDPGTLGTYLGQGSQKLPVQLFAPADFAEKTVPTPRSGPPARVVASLVKSLDGDSREVFLLTEGRGGGWGGGGRGENPSADAAPRTGAPGGPGGDGAPRGGMDWAARRGAEESGIALNPAWMEERAGQLIAALPVEEQEAARAQLDEFRAFRERMEGLDAEARRAAAEEFFSNPQAQERMEENMAVRDSKRTPEQREARYRRSAERRMEARESAGIPLKARP